MTTNNNFTKGHTKLSHQFVQNNKHNKHKIIYSTIPTSSLSAKRSSKLKNPELESNERVEKIVRERKASSKLRLEAIKKKKEVEDKKQKKLERLREKEELTKIKKKLDEEFKEHNEIMEDIEKSKIKNLRI